MTMKPHLAVVALSVVLAACTGSRFQQEQVPAAPVPTAPLPSTAPVVPRYQSPSARAAAPQTDDLNTTPGDLMDCTTESCRINCSSKVAARNKPKWCANFE